MVGEVYGAYKGFTSILELGKKFLEVRDAAARNEIVVDFTRQIMDAQQHEASLLERIRELEKRVVQFENWEAEKQRYALAKVDSGAVVYRLKAGMEHGEPSHDTCAHCYENNEKSILQANTYNPGRCDVLECHRCGSVIYVHGQPRPEHDKMRPRTNRAR